MAVETVLTFFGDIEMTPEHLKDLKPGLMFAWGKVPNSPDGVYMTNNDIGRSLIWCAVRGNGIPDWAIYVHWEDNGLEYAMTNGDKLVNKDYIKMLVPCTDEAMKWYRL